MRRLLAACTAALLCTAAASAQSYPDAHPNGYELGLQSVNNSGQVGTVTLFNHGPKTLMVLHLSGAVRPAQSVRLYRGHDCDADIETKPAFFLNDAKNGSSVSTAPLGWDRLLSGNYNVVVFSSNRAGARASACGHLYA